MIAGSERDVPAHPLKASPEIAADACMINDRQQRYRRERLRSIVWIAPMNIDISACTRQIASCLVSKRSPLRQISAFLRLNAAGNESPRRWRWWRVGLERPDRHIGHRCIESGHQSQ